MSSLPSEETRKSPGQDPDRSGRVRLMFDGIAPRYELINRLFSAGRDAYWRRKTVQLSGAGPDDDVLDIACGTGDLTRAFASRRPRTLTGCDFAPRMLQRAVHRSDDHARWCLADALRLPFRDASFSITACAFGIRNFEDPDRALREMRRVTRSGGRAVILEFSRPERRWFRRVYETYTGRIMPWGASLISRDRSGAYRYLPRSVVSFSETGDLGRRLVLAGFAQCRSTSLTFGVVKVYVAEGGSPT